LAARLVPRRYGHRHIRRTEQPGKFWFNVTTYVAFVVFGLFLAGKGLAFAP
jgi:hypothetical protein